MLTPFPKTIDNIKSWIRLKRVLLLAIPTGIIAGLGSVIFFALLDVSHSFFLEYLTGYFPPGPGGEHSLIHIPAKELTRWMFFVVPTVGGLLAGWLIYTFAPEAEGHGTDAALDSYHFRHAIIRGRIPLIKTIASAITIGSGGSGGREGPIAQIGAGFGSIIAQKLKLTETERRVLMMAGMSAGIGSIFHAPLAGAIFAAEILYRDIDMEYELLVPSAITSVVAYCVFALFFGFDHLFITPDMTFTDGGEILPYTILALVVAVAAGFYSKMFYKIRDMFVALPVPPHFKPAIGGFLTGVVGFFLPSSIYTGYGILQQAFHGHLAIGFLFAVAIAKMFTTAFSIASGGSGGVFGPSVVIGGALGGSIGLILQKIMPSLVPTPQTYIIVGMAGFFASAASTPFSTIIMVSEMTGSYGLLLPAVWVTTLAFLFRSRTGIYEKQRITRHDTPIHHADFLQGLLGRLTVGDLLNRAQTKTPRTVDPDLSLKELSGIIKENPQDFYTVVNKDGKCIGIINTAEARKACSIPTANENATAQDLTQKCQIVYQGDSLGTALTLMVNNNHDELVVLSSQDTTAGTLGVLCRNDILKAYDPEITSVKAGHNIKHPAPR
jgi:chloride channel protein, CIC family